MKLKPPLESRRVRTQPCTVTRLPTASAFRACDTLIFSMTASTKRVTTEYTEYTEKRRKKNIESEEGREESSIWPVCATPERGASRSFFPFIVLLSLLSFFRDPLARVPRRVFRGGSLLFLSAVLLVGFFRGDLLCHDQAAPDLLALRIDVDAAGALRVVAVVVQDVDVEDEARLRYRLEPVDVVLAVGRVRALAGLEDTVDGRADQVVVLVVLDAVVVLPLEVAAQDDEASTHVVVTVRHDRTSLLHAEDLLAKVQLLRQTLDLAQVDADARHPAVRQPHAPGDTVEVEQLQQLRQLDALVERFELRLEIDVLDLAVLDVLRQVGEFLHPLMDDRLDCIAEQVALEQRLDQAVGHQAAEHRLVEGTPRQIGHRPFSGLVGGLWLLYESQIQLTGRGPRSEPKFAPSRWRGFRSRAPRLCLRRSALSAAAR